MGIISWPIVSGAAYFKTEEDSGPLAYGFYSQALTGLKTNEFKLTLPGFLNPSWTNLHGNNGFT
jgi:hypothetical protein